MVGKPAVQVVITGDTKGLDKALDKSGKAVNNFGSTALGVFAGTAMTAGVGLAIDAVKGLANFALGGIDALDALGDNVARLDGLAKGLGDTVEATDLSRFGVDKGEAAAASLAIAKVGKSLRLNGKELTRVTPKFTEMAAQLASLGDGDPEKQAELLAKALGGSAKAAKELGIHLPKGEDVTPMDTYRSIVEQLAPKLKEATSGTASLADVGDRWDATLANIQLELAGFLEQLAPVISQLMDALMPILREFVDTVGPIVAEVFGRIAEAISGFLESGGGQAIADLFGTIVGVLGELVGFVVDNVLPVLLDLAAGIGETLGPILERIANEVVPALVDVFHELLPILEGVWGFVGATVVPLLVDGLFPILGKVLDVVLDVAVAVLKNLGPAIKILADRFGDLLEFLQPVFRWLNDILGVAGDVIGKLGDIKLPELPFGIFGGQSAPASARGLGAPVGLAAGTTINVRVGVGDPVAIGRSVARYLGTYQLRGGTVG